MKSTAKRIFAALAVALIVPTIPTMANSGLIKVTVAQDTPYKRVAATGKAAAAGKKFQIAPVKMQTSTAPASTPAPAPKRVVVQPHWR